MNGQGQCKECGTSFDRRLDGGHPQEFCMPACRRAGINRRYASKHPEKLGRKKRAAQLARKTLKQHEKKHEKEQMIVKRFCARIQKKERSRQLKKERRLADRRLRRLQKPDLYRLDKKRERNRYKSAHPEKVTEGKKRYATKHPEKVREIMKRYLVRKKARESALEFLVAQTILKEKLNGQYSKSAS